MAIGRIPEPGTGIPESIIAAKGDLIVGTANDTPGILSVGTNGHTLVADSSVSPQGLKWAVDPVADVITTAGDLIYGTAADTVARLGIGTAGQVLQVNSGATAPQWATPAAGGGGKVLQVVSATTTTSTTISTTTYTDTTISATITPTLATSKILVLVNAPIYASRAGEKCAMGARLVKGATTLETWGRIFTDITGTLSSPKDIQISTMFDLKYMDSPATTSATTYKIQGNHDESGITTIWQNGSALSSIILLEIGV